MYVHLTVEQRQLALRLKAKGLSLREIGPQVGSSPAATSAFSTSGKLAGHFAPSLIRTSTAFSGRRLGSGSGLSCSAC